ncbi:MAG: ABC transporter ATP-binding protein [Elainellaceae cyanobacterium]
MAEPLLEVQDVYAGYVSGLDILQGINFRVMPGELVAVVGPNGAGKSTLAKAIFGLLTPHAGEVVFQGQSLVGLRPNQIVQRGLCYVPQLSNVFPSLTVDENLEMGGFLVQGSLTSRKQDVLQLFPALADRYHQRAGTLSGGERQMLAMGRALMLTPALLLLDEPSAALSPMLVSSTLAQIQRINEAGTAIVLVEQNARQALAIAHRGYVLDMGRDRVEGPGLDLLENPEVAALYLGGKK